MITIPFTLMLKIIESSKISASIATRANDNKVIGSDGSWKSNLFKFTNIKNLSKTRNLEQTS